MLNSIYFSATGTTRRCIDAIAGAIDLPAKASVNLADRAEAAPAAFGPEDVVLVGAPVYGGRLPAICAEKLRELSGNGARAIAVVVYGNRDYDDALLELTDTLREAGFEVVAAAAFIGQHSIFPKAGMSRPDKQDMALLEQFGRSCRAALESGVAPRLELKGRRPYKRYGGVPLHPETDRAKCKQCGRCVDLCPVGAISSDAPWDTNAGLCITCGRCISSCSTGARQYRGLKYRMTNAIFNMAFGKR